MTTYETTLTMHGKQIHLREVGTTTTLCGEKSLGKTRLEPHQASCGLCLKVVRSRK